jgi:hypothetical protein
MRKRLADPVPAQDDPICVAGVDLVAAYDAMDAAGELMRRWEASGQWIHDGDGDGDERDGRLS